MRRRRHNRRGRNPALGMGARITRRDFLNGVSVAVGGSIAGGLLPGLAMPGRAAAAAPQDKAGYYPPALTGLRGSQSAASKSPTACATAVFGRNPARSPIPASATIWWSWAAASAVCQPRTSIAQVAEMRASSFSTTMMTSAAMPSATSFSSAAAWR